MKTAVQLIDEAYQEQLKALVTRLAARLTQTQADIAEREFIQDLDALAKAKAIATRVFSK